MTATQVYKAKSPRIRKNIKHVFVFIIRNQTELNARFEEFSALYAQTVVLNMYKEATDKNTFIPTHSSNVP